MSKVEQSSLPTEDGVITSMDHPIKLEAFEGPLDLLLFLIRKHEINIYDIPIREVTEQYLAALSTMKKMNLEIAGDFFVMAATLMYIKSRMLLPKIDQKPEVQEEEDIDPRWELVQQLLHYKKIKCAAAELEELILKNQYCITRQVKKTSSSLQDQPLVKSDPIELWTLFNQVVRRLSERIVIGEITDEEVTVADCMEKILQLLEKEKCFYFSSLIPQKCTVHRLAATFLAILELTRLKKLQIKQTELFGDIELKPRFEEDKTAISEKSISLESSSKLISEFDEDNN